MFHFQSKLKLKSREAILQITREVSGLNTFSPNCQVWFAEFIFPLTDNISPFPGYHNQLAKLTRCLLASSGPSIICALVITQRILAIHFASSVFLTVHQQFWFSLIWKQCGLERHWNLETSSLGINLIWSTQIKKELTPSPSKMAWCSWVLSELGQGQSLMSDVDGGPWQSCGILVVLVCVRCLLCTQHLVTTLYFWITFSAGVATNMTKCAAPLSSH